jgi:GDP/UDP-N,N'-diacetylbacillosamine 2-epimerase (hydrolysing)
MPAHPRADRLRRICVFSGKRGGYGAYVPLMRAVEADPELELLILLGDMHASQEFGNTAAEVRSAFPGAALELIEMGTGRGDSPRVRAENLAACLAGASALLDERQPDVVLVHGDRGEHLMVALAAVTLGIAVAHTQGGERSGNIDELQRHAITKLAHLHFPETEAAAQRLHRLGEDPWRVEVVGSTYVDRICAGLFADAGEARARVGLGVAEPFVLAVVHPETFLDDDANRSQAEAVFAGIGKADVRAIVTYPCSDPGYQGALDALRAVERDPRFIIRPNIDQDVYLGLMSEAVALVGNSSAAMVEAPYFRLPALNVGRRQDGRDRDENVVDVEPSSAAVASALARVSKPEFRASLGGGRRLGDGGAGQRIVERLKAVALDERLFRKQIAY